MAILRRFRFTSITYRLIFACVAAACLIYGVSYWQVHGLLEEGTGSWLTEAAEARVNAVSAEIGLHLQPVEQGALALAVLAESAMPGSHPLTPGVLSLVLPSDTPVRAITAFRPRAEQSADDFEGWRVEPGSALTPLPPGSQAVLVDRCGQPRKPRWTAPYPQPGSATAYAMTYCFPLFPRHSGGEGVATGILAVEVTLDWLPPLAAERLRVRDRFERQWVGHPFVRLPVAGQTLLPAPDLRGVPSSPGGDVAVTRAGRGLWVQRTMTDTGWNLGIGFPESELERLHRKYLWLLIGSMMKDMLLMCAVVALVTRHTTRQLRAFIITTEGMARGNLDAELPVVHERDEVGRLARSFRHMRDALKLHIARLQDETAARQKLESELQIAGQIQQSMVPRLGGGGDSRYALSAVLQPARQVGGDLYDFFPVGGDKVCLVIGDVAGKGMPAALLMARTVTLVRALARQPACPVDILSAVNREMCRNNDDCQFVTLFCGVLDLTSGGFHYASSGHDAPVLLRDGQAVLLDLETGPPLGLEEDAEYPQAATILRANDQILLYTDGITEAINDRGEQYTVERLLAVLQAHPPTGPARTVRTVRHFLRRFVAGAAQSDDITLLALQYYPAALLAGEGRALEWTITVNSELTELAAVRARLGDLLATAGASATLIENTRLICEEILVNIIQYGYAGRPGHRIDLLLRLDGKGLELTFADDGAPFNPLAEIPAADLDRDDEARALGGLGFLLVRELSSSLDYRHEGGRNILVVRQSASAGNGYDSHPAAESAVTAAVIPQGGNP